MPCDINVTYTSRKSALMGYNSVADNTGLFSFAYLLLPGAFLAAAVWGGQWGGDIFIWGAKNFG